MNLQDRYQAFCTFIDWLLGDTCLSQHWKHSLKAGAEIHDCSRLVQVFDRLFLNSHNVRLVKGGQEPIYLPVTKQRASAEIVFTRDYFASALHEIAHWCVAGAERRTQVDYGYWYAPDGRTAGQQQEFEQVEIVPQALEWVFSAAAGFRFRVSADNLDAGLGASEVFKHNIFLKVMEFCETGLPKRAGLFTRALASEFGCSDPLDTRHYSIESLSL